MGASRNYTGPVVPNAGARGDNFGKSRPRGRRRRPKWSRSHSDGLRGQGRNRLAQDASGNGAQWRPRSLGGGVKREVGCRSYSGGKRDLCPKEAGRRAVSGRHSIYASAERANSCDPGGCTGEEKAAPCSRRPETSPRSAQEVARAPRPVVPAARARRRARRSRAGRRPRRRSRSVTL